MEANSKNVNIRSQVSINTKKTLIVHLQFVMGIEILFTFKKREFFTTSSVFVLIRVSM